MYARVSFYVCLCIHELMFLDSVLINYPLANEVAKGYSNATVRPSVTSL